MAKEPKPSWAGDLFPVGIHYYAGVVENAEQVMERHKVATQSSFGTRSSTKKAHVHPSSSTDKENDTAETKPKVGAIVHN